ncbi:cysteine hydrolase family protein [Pararhodobacter zhoushanensis]|uniref:Cysteine hydrolase n=1 Tax=Pararhodobacter zhoushanensis TaxID=2479545 RepID=A0ABT3H1U9_9RHOB|nr:cysteine hydrolase [Pararhodobacter zhoushanensis]MCW1933824.1 cysteine hydrolase [Pararhodobacter zhoushanensis]
MMIASVLGVLALSAALWLALGIRRIGAISRGKPIGARSGTAVLLIDLQSVFWDHGPYPEAATSVAEAAILDEISAAKRNGLPIIAIRQEWSIPSTKVIARLAMKGQAVEGTPGVDLAAPFSGLVDHVLVKRVQDAFETGDLDRLLATLGVGTLRIVGLDFNYCVLKTALAARNRGYAVTVVKQGTLSAKPTAQAEQRMATAGLHVQ